MDSVPADFLSDASQEQDEPEAETPIRKHPTLFQLRSGQCRFPLGRKNEPAEFFCGKPTALPKPYCPECCLLAYVPTRPKR